MDFGFSEQQRDVQNLAREILGEQVNPEKLAQYDRYQAPRFDRELWVQIAQAGLLGVAIDEQYGGMGFGFFEAGLIAEEVGRNIAPLPYISHCISAALPIQQFGSDEQKARLLPGAVSGDVLLTAALMEANNEDPTQPLLCRAQASAEGVQISGEKLCVPFAEQADHILLAVAGEAGPVVVLLQAGMPGLSLESMEVSTYEPQYRLTLNDVSVSSDNVLASGDQAAALLKQLSETTTAALCAHQLGAADKAMRMTASYTAERQQFGVPIATFQAVGHRAANCFIDVECLRLNCYQAISRLDDGVESSVEVQIAKVWAGDVGHRVSYAAQHLHGGTGIDRDYPLWRYCTWLRHNEMMLGGSARNLAALGEKIAAGEAFCA